MKIIVGLGNPGPKYETTRHNVGFLAIDRLVDEWKATGPARSNEGEVFQATVKGEKVALIKPQTYMNNSGRTVGPIYKFYKCEPADLIVIHDDLDLKPMAVRIKTGGGTGGHNGLKSIDAHLGAGQTGYHRIRIGIGKPGMPGLSAPSLMATADYVLQQYSDAELGELDRVLDVAVQAAEMIVAGDVADAMNRFNGESGSKGR